MDALFLAVLNMSLTASYVIVFVIVIRLFMKKFPKLYSYALWFVVLFRLICPFSFDSIFSLIPKNVSIPQDIAYLPKPVINSGIAAIDSAVNKVLPPPVNPAASVNPMQIWLAIGEAVWLIGIAILIIYSVFTTVKLYNNLRNAKHLQENIYLVNGYKTPFVFGIVNPKIYLPDHLSENEKSYVLLHEQTHIKRLDHLVKLIFFILTCIHWFNPLVWLAFYLMGQDMELSCDEKVVKQMGSSIKKEYSSSLLSMSTGRRILGGSPIAFGENNTEGRIKNVLNYKKPALWVLIVVSIIIVIFIIGLISNPKSNEVIEIKEQESVEKRFYIMTANDGGPHGCEYGTTREAGQIDTLEMISMLEELQGFVFDEDYVSQQYIEFQFLDDEPKEINLLYIAKDGLQTEYPIDSATYEIKVPEKVGFHRFFSDITWENGEKETVFFSITIKSKNFGIISTYLKEEYTKVFSPYYELLDFIISDYQEEVVNGNVEAVFNYTVIEKNYDRDPDTVEYIKEAKEKGDKYYQTYYDEYLQARESNLYFKAVIDEKGGISLYTKNPAIESDEWQQVEMSDYIIKKHEKIPEEQNIEFEEATNIINGILPIYHEVSLIFNGYIDTEDIVIKDENNKAYMQVINDKYESIEDIKKLLQSIFTSEYIEAAYKKYFESAYPLFKEIEGELYIALASGAVKSPSDSPIEEIYDLKNDSFTATISFGGGERGSESRHNFYFKKANESWLIDSIE